MFSEMIEEAVKWPGNETGGMMFGRIKENESGLEIIIEKTLIPPEEECVRNNTYFEINPEYARLILDNENLLYLGNWHKHLGYGGPSYGDHRQITEFFTLNPHKNLVVSIIVDFLTENDYELTVEVYIRNVNNGEEAKNSFQTFRISESNLTFFSEENKISEKVVGITKEQVSIIKQELVQGYNSEFSIEDIHQFTGSTSDEKLLSFPFQFYIETNGNKRTLDLMVLISFPPNFPDGQIYIDISSQDFSKKFTVEKHPANVLYEKELIQPFLLLLRATLEENIPLLMKEPLWKVMCGSDE
jgi:hypothetical protein